MTKKKLLKKTNKLTLQPNPRSFVSTSMMETQISMLDKFDGTTLKFQGFLLSSQALFKVASLLIY